MLLLAKEWTEVVDYVRKNPDKASSSLELQKGAKAKPLHVACALKAPIEVIRVLVEANPEALKTNNSSGRLPLHCLFLNRCPSLDVLSFVIVSYPDACSISDANGKLPIHYACELDGVIDKVFGLILSTHPEGAHAIDSFGYLPIDYASSNSDDVTKKASLIALDESKVCARVDEVVTPDESSSAIDKEHSTDESAKLLSKIELLQAQLKSSTKLIQLLMETNGSKLSSYSKQDEAEVVKVQATARTWLAERRVKILNDDVKATIEKYTSDVGGVNDMDAVLMEPLLKLESQLSAIIDLQQYGIMTHG